jgi:hypothetical protein
MPILSRKSRVLSDCINRARRWFQVSSLVHPPHSGGSARNRMAIALDLVSGADCQGLSSYSQKCSYPSLNPGNLMSRVRIAIIAQVRRVLKQPCSSSPGAGAEVVTHHNVFNLDCDNSITRYSWHHTDQNLYLPNWG